MLLLSIFVSFLRIIYDNDRELILQILNVFYVNIQTKDRQIAILSPIISSIRTKYAHNPALTHPRTLFAVLHSPAFYLLNIITYQYRFLNLFSRFRYVRDLSFSLTPQICRRGGTANLLANFCGLRFFLREQVNAKTFYENYRSVLYHLGRFVFRLCKVRILRATWCGSLIFP